MGNDVRGGKQNVTIHPEEGNLEDGLEIIYGQYVVRERVRTIIADGHHHLAII